MEHVKKRNDAPQQYDTRARLGIKCHIAPAK